MLARLKAVSIPALPPSEAVNFIGWGPGSGLVPAFRSPN